MFPLFFSSFSSWMDSCVPLRLWCRRPCPCPRSCEISFAVSFMISLFSSFLSIAKLLSILNQILPTHPLKYAARLHALAGPRMIVHLDNLMISRARLGFEMCYLGLGVSSSAVPMLLSPHSVQKGHRFHFSFTPFLTLVHRLPRPATLNIQQQRRCSVHIPPAI